jgi:hypothetical protein
MLDNKRYTFDKQETIKQITMIDILLRRDPFIHKCITV